MDPIDYKIYVNNLDIWVRVQVIGEGWPLLFLHGALSSGSLFYPLLPYFRDYKCILLDRSGCGLSANTKQEDLSRNGMATFNASIVEAVCDFFKLDTIDIIASSFGGYLALLYVMDHHNRTRKVVLLGCPALIENWNLTTFMKIITAWPIKWLLPKLPVSKFTLKKILKQLGHAQSLGGNVIPLPFLNWYMALFNYTDTQQNELNLLSRVLDRGSMSEERILALEEVAKIENPVLFIYGTNDPFGSKTFAEMFYGSLKKGKFYIVPGGGHLPWIDTPTLIASHITRFLP
jgi:pimeloyl-ACP methyl ester carboxylesterase